MAAVWWGDLAFKLNPGKKKYWGATEYSWQRGKWKTKLAALKYFHNGNRTLKGRKGKIA